MKRTTIVGNDQIMETLRSLAKQRGVSFAEVVREALAEKAKELRPKPKSVGIETSTSSKTAIAESAKRIPPRSWR